MVVSGNPENLRKFLELFIYEEDIGGDKKEYFARTFLESWKNIGEFMEDKKEEIENGVIDINGWCAWSCHSCWIEGYPKGKECITLIEACKKFKVSVVVESEEGGMQFEEEIECDEEGNLKEDCYDFVDWKCKKCGEKSGFPRAYEKESLEDETCYNCDSEGFWEDIREMEIKDLKDMRVIVSEEEWVKCSEELKLELIALSRMTGEDIQNNLTDEENKLYDKLAYDLDGGLK